MKTREIAAGSDLNKSKTRSNARVGWLGGGEPGPESGCTLWLGWLRCPGIGEAISGNSE